jgi:hypothetical protein
VTRIGHWSEQELRDAWARWGELRPEWADWRVRIEVRMQESIDVVVPSRNGLKPGGSVAVVRLEEPQSGVAGGYGTVCSWEVLPSAVMAVHRAMEAAFTDAALMRRCQLRLPGWEDALVMFVWDRMRPRG